MGCSLRSRLLDYCGRYVAAVAVIQFGNQLELWYNTLCQKKTLFSVNIRDFKAKLVIQMLGKMYCI